MKLKITFDAAEPITGEASILIDRAPETVFRFIADDFFKNYPKWAVEVVELHPLDGDKVCLGAKGRQVRRDVDALIDSTFEIIDYQPPSSFIFQGINPPYRNIYSMERIDDSTTTKLIFKFELLEIDIFMRPFAKLIRVAIEDGAETTVEKIKELILAEQ